MLRSLTVAAWVMFFNGLLALTIGSTAFGQDQSFQLSAHSDVPIDVRHAATIDDERIRRIVEDVLEDRSNANSVVATGYEQASSWSPAETALERLTVRLGNGGMLKIYGYGRGDLIFASSRLNNAIVPFFVLSEDAASMSSGVQVPEDDSQFNVNVRLTRLGFDFSGTQAEWLGNADLSAKIEIDFETLLGITSESRAVPRIRHAYAQMRWGEFSLLMGQTFDAISPLNPMINDDSLMWNAGNLGDRRAQLRTNWDHDLGDQRRLSIVSALSSAGAIDGQDLDGNGLRDGEDSGLPALQQRFGYRFPTAVPDGMAELGVYWFLAWENIAVPIAGEDDFVSRGVGIDWSLPLDDRITWRGEAWYGRDVSDWRGGIAQGVNTTTGEEIESRGGWTELQIEPFEWWRFAVGATVDDPVDNDLIGNTTQRTLNWTWYLGNRFSLGGGLNVAVNLEFWNTEYLTLDKGDAMRFKTWVVQRF